MNTSKIKATFIDNLYLAVSLVGSLFFILVLLFPSLSSIPTLRTKLSAKNEELKQLKAKSSRLNSLISNQSTLKANLKLVDMAVPSKDNVPNLMTQIQRIASDSGVTLKALQFGTSSLNTSAGESNRVLADKNIKRVLLQAIAEGAFSNLQSFLRNLEEASRLISVDNVTFENKKSGSSVASTLGLTSYYVDNVPTDPSFSLDLGSEDLKTTLVKLKSMKIYETETTFSGVGKANPFE